MGNGVMNVGSEGCIGWMREGGGVGKSSCSIANNFFVRIRVFFLGVGFVDSFLNGCGRIGSGTQRSLSPRWKQSAK